ncbi:MAG: aminotransferase class V-fold PLP-dependent enzyme, partial [Anaerovibrio sp.]|uniref:aminotransferase class I/II-fold pyridoxal phosphate-dependent enzyme n=1 Tax=Anaerovibrio sp. TaxID=1872532 RepID=UPI001B13CFBD
MFEDIRLDNNWKLNQNEAPISEAMDKYARDGALAFHTPGHKQGLGAHSRLKRLITAEGLKQEVSLMEELDDLHEPFGCIKQAEALAAELWGARDTMFMINGTTGAIHAMILGTLQPGDKVLVPRNAHRSIIGGIILAGAQPVYIVPEIVEALGIAGVLSVDAVREAVAKNPDARALIAVYPTYYGMAGDLQAIADILHEHNMLLLVDEAHGAHLKFAQHIEGMPKQALDLGADVVAQSTHKVLGSMTQTSMLHIGSQRVSRERIR